MDSILDDVLPSLTDDTEQERAEKIAGLRKLANWLEAQPEAQMPPQIAIAEWCKTKQTLADRMRQLGGHWEKQENPTDGYFELHLNFSPGIYYELFAKRENVCERVVIGTKEVEVEGPDPAAVEALPKLKRTETIEDVEWVCPESLLA
jgi:hypothetical protein